MRLVGLRNTRSKVVTAIRAVTSVLIAADSTKTGKAFGSVMATALRLHRSNGAGGESDEAQYGTTE